MQPEQRDPRDPRDPRDRRVICVELTLASGEKLERSWTFQQIDQAWQEGREDPIAFLRAAPPSWLQGVRRAWPHPQDPITHTGEVTEGHEQEAREWLGVSGGE